MGINRFSTQNTLGRFWQKHSHGLFSAYVARFFKKRLTTTYWVLSNRLCFQIFSRAIPSSRVQSSRNIL